MGLSCGLPLPETMKVLKPFARRYVTGSSMGS